jgi:hypothetical protein
MDINAFLKDLLDRSNTYNTKEYLELWQEKAVLDDPSVGQVLKDVRVSRNILKVILLITKTKHG